MQRALDFLTQFKDVALATSENNIPKIRQFQIMKQDGPVLYFATSAKKAVWEQLQQNPNVEILASNQNISVRCAGKVSFDVDQDTKQWIYENNSVLQRLYESYEYMQYFKLLISTIDYYDLSPTPPINKHFDLESGIEADGYVGQRFSK